MDENVRPLGSDLLENEFTDHDSVPREFAEVAELLDSPYPRSPSRALYSDGPFAPLHVESDDDGSFEQGRRFSSLSDSTSGSEADSSDLSADATSHTPPTNDQPPESSSTGSEAARRRLEFLRNEIENLRQSRIRIAEQFRRVRASREQVERLFGQRELREGYRHSSPLFLFGERLPEQIQQGDPRQFSPFLAGDLTVSQPQRTATERPQVPADDLVEMEVEMVGENRHPAASGPASQPRGQRPTVIDLTEEPDSPEQPTITLPDAPRFVRPAANPRRQHSDNQRSRPQSQNPRRQLSQHGRTPSLARSDGSLLGPAGGAHVIDLTDDSPHPDEPQRTQHGRQGNDERADPQLDFLGIVERLGRLRDQVENRHNLLGGGLDVFQRLGGHIFGRQPADVELEIIGQAPGPGFPPNMDNPLGNNRVFLNYQGNGFSRNVAAPKPAHVPPPPARPGFTRATGDDIAVICPSCEQELRYNPDSDEPTTPPAKKARTRKDREEHHFWAVKACGHVFCKSCYEHRRPSAKSPTKTSFRIDGSRKILCAVEDCDSDVTNKGSWVGIFL